MHSFKNPQTTQSRPKHPQALPSRRTLMNVRKSSAMPPKCVRMLFFSSSPAVWRTCTPAAVEPRQRSKLVGAQQQQVGSMARAAAASGAASRRAGAEHRRLQRRLQQLAVERTQDLLVRQREVQPFHTSPQKLLPQVSTRCDRPTEPHLNGQALAAGKDEGEVGVEIRVCPALVQLSIHLPETGAGRDGAVGIAAALG